MQAGAGRAPPRPPSGLSNSSGTKPSREADVIDMSWGTGAACSALFADVIAQARANNVVVVAAAGNTFTARKLAPQGIASRASCPGALAVGSLDENGNRARYSAYGPE